jgi:hypothetical protein
MASFKPMVLISCSMLELLQQHMHKQQALNKSKATLAAAAAAEMSGDGPNDLPDTPAGDVQLNTAAESSSVPIDSMVATGQNVFGGQSADEVPKSSVVSPPSPSPSSSKKSKKSDLSPQHPSQRWFYSHPHPSDSDSDT